MTGHFTSYKTRPNHELATLEVVQLTGEGRLDDAGIDRLRSDFEPSLESAHEMLADLQGRLELGREYRRSLVGDNVGRHDVLIERSLEHPVDIVPLPIPQAAKLENCCAVADFFHLRTTQVVLELGVSDQHDRQLPTAFGDEFDKTLQRDERLGVGLCG